MRALLAAALLALALPAAADAHANLLRTAPADGARLQQAPRAVRVVFDDDVAAGPSIAAIRNGGGSVLGGRARAAGRTLVIPLRPRLPSGTYSVRWSIVSDDGHLESGVIAFGVGTSARPVAALAAGANGPGSEDVVTRWLFLAGVLAAVGIALFSLVTGADGEPVALVLSVAGVVAALGAAEGAHRAGLSTRAGTALVAGSAFAVLVALAAGAATLERRLLRPATVLALGLVAVPTVAGHALDPGLGRVNVAADLLHVAGAAAWVGVLLGIVVTGRTRRTLWLALAGVGVLAVTGVVRASYELLRVSQLWHTSYGRALLVKTGILVVALAAGWVVRARAGRRAAAELALAGGIVVAAAFLVLERPGRDILRPLAPAVALPTQPSPPPTPPPPAAVVVAKEAGPWGVALAAQPRRLTAIVLSPAGGGASGLDVSVDGDPAAPCGQGCYRVAGPHHRDVSVEVEGETAAFTLPARAPGAGALVHRLRARFRTLSSVEYVERLASDETHSVTSRWHLEAPDRLAYTIRDGAGAVVIGGRRWDQAGRGARWLESPQTPLTMPAPQWEHERNAHLLNRSTVSFLDQSIPAYFTVTFDPRTLLPRALHMTAAAHFMVDRYVRFDSGDPIRPPR